MPPYTLIFLLLVVHHSTTTLVPVFSGNNPFCSSSSQLNYTDLTLLYRNCYWDTIENNAEYMENNTVYIKTGDIDDMWIRDSTSQVNHYLPNISHSPKLKDLVEGTILRLAFYQPHSWYANSFRKYFKDNSSLTDLDRHYGRYGYIGTRNYEADSGAYFVRLLHRYYTFSQSKKDAIQFLQHSNIRASVNGILSTWQTEQYHDTKSKYRHPALVYGGMGTQVNYTGMVWSGFRPSDEPTTYGYNIPVNVMITAALDYLGNLSLSVWNNYTLCQAVNILKYQVFSGIQQYGIREGRYVYETDGRGNHVTLDDANVPSLLSIPYLIGDTNLPYDPVLYQTTRNWVLSPLNPYYYNCTYVGIGSSHTSQYYIWPMSLIIQGMTVSDLEIQQDLLKCIIPIGAAHDYYLTESFNCNYIDSSTRAKFGWVNSLFAEWAGPLLQKGFLQ